MRRQTTPPAEIYTVFESPIGTLTASTDGKNITSLHIEGDRYFPAAPSSWIKDTNNPLLKQLEIQVTDYFDSKRKNFTVPLAIRGTTFQQEVWSALQEIPTGATTTYSKIAQQIGKPAAVRAVGTAIGRNPICIIIPCHRVLASDGSLGGYVAGLERKQTLLQLEKAL